ncbi:MAG: urease accessory protein UreE [Cyanobacteria bacterium CAN_BIN43]|nr:urease accessory protein UreE [Cyanobacteria bacterium CAN_BIN43]
MNMILTEKLPQDVAEKISFTLALTAEDRVRSRHHFESDGQSFSLQLPRGTVLYHNDLLKAESGERVQIIAKPEPVMTVTAKTPLDLLKAAYHLGNRHVPLEVTATYLRLSPDSVLQSMLEQLGAQVIEEILPFQPEMGAYSQSHDHS